MTTPRARLFGRILGPPLIVFVAAAATVLVRRSLADPPAAATCHQDHALEPTSAIARDAPLLSSRLHAPEHGGRRLDAAPPGRRAERLPRASEQFPLDPSWEHVEVDDGESLGVHAGAFSRELNSREVLDGIKNNCVYDSGRTRRDIEPKEGATVLTLSLLSSSESITVVDARVTDPGRADEYQQRCFESWLARLVVSVPGIPPGSRYRVRWPIAF